MDNNIMKMTIRIKAIAFFLLLCPLCGSAQSLGDRPSAAVENRLIDAVRLYDDGRLDEAKESLADLAALAPDNDAVWYYAGLVAVAQEDYDAAVGFFNKAAGLDPTNYWYRERLSRLYEYRGEYDLTTSLYEQMLKDFPDKTDSYFSLLGLYMRHGQYDKALSTLDTIEINMGKNERIASTRYDIYMATDRPEDAIAALEAYNAEFSSPTVLSMMGDYWLNRYEDSLALSCYDEAIELQGDYVPALLGRTEVFRTTRRYPLYFDAVQEFVDNGDISPMPKGLYLSNAVRSLDPSFMRMFRDRMDGIFDSCLEKYPTDSTLVSSAGMYLFATERVDSAKTLFARMSGLYPTSISIAATYVQLLSYAEDWPRLAEESLDAAGRFPEEPAFMQYNIIANYNLENYDTVLGACKNLIELYPDDTSQTLSAYSTMGDMYHKLGNEKDAYKSYEAALKIDPDYNPVLNNYAYFLSLSGKNLKKALAMSRRTVDSEPDNPTYLDTYAWILYLMGKPAEAKPYFKHAMLYGGKDSATILDHYAEVLYSLKEYELAKVYWSQAKAKNDGDIEDLDERVKARLGAIGGK